MEGEGEGEIKAARKHRRNMNNHRNSQKRNIKNDFHQVTYMKVKRATEVTEKWEELEKEEEGEK